MSLFPRSKEEEEEDDKEEEDGGGRSSSNTTSSSSEDEESATSSSASSHSPEQHKRLDVSSFGKSLNKPSSPTAVAVNAAAATISKSRDFVEDDGSARLSSVAHSSSRETSRQV